LFARNVFNFVSLMVKDGKIDLSDELVQAAAIKKAS
jgi:NAD/NADP transhydrogenase alpha subunit